jgi:hypothetical protein
LVCNSHLLFIRAGIYISLHSHTNEKAHPISKAKQLWKLNALYSKRQFEIFRNQSPFQLLPNGFAKIKLNKDYFFVTIEARMGHPALSAAAAQKHINRIKQ